MLASKQTSASKYIDIYIYLIQFLKKYIINLNILKE